MQGRLTVFFVANVYDTYKTLPSLAPPLELRKSKHVGRVANLLMNFGRQFGTLVLASALLWSLGCEKKKPQLPAQAKAPAETVSAPLPSEISETVPPPAPPAPNPAPPEQQTATTTPPKRRAKKKVTTTTPASSVAAAATPPATTPANNGGNTTVAVAHPPANPATESTPDPAIAADMTSAQLTRQKQSTAQLLDETEKSIGGLKGLSHDEEEMLAQIRSYVSQSRKATSDGDFERAYNLATKAHLLSDALVKK